MRRSWFVAVLTISIFVSVSCGGTSTVPRSPGNESSNTPTSVTQLGIGGSTSDAETPAAGIQTTSSSVLEASPSTTTADNSEIESNDPETKESEANDGQVVTTTTPAAPTTTFGVVTEEPADVKSGVETWEPDA